MTAIYIFIVALVSIMNLVVFNIQTNDFNTDVLVASNLAREGIEAVRNIRDANWENDRLFADQLRYNEKSSYLDYNTEINLETQATFLLQNNYLDAGYGYEISTIGLSWNNCISPIYPYSSDVASNIFELCRLYLVSPSSDESKRQYNYVIYNTDMPKIATQFYRILYINQICKNGPWPYGEKILRDANLDDPQVVSKHCPVDADLIGLQVIARVGWYSSHGFKEIMLEDKLYNWQSEKDSEID